MLKKRTFLQKFLLFAVALLCAATLLSCNKTKLEFSDLKINVNDAEASAGVYTILYDIPSEGDYREKYGIYVSAACFDEDNSEIPVSGSLTVTLEKNKHYTILITVTSNDGQRKTASYTVSTEVIYPTVTFMANNVVVATKRLVFGGNLLDFPAVPNPTGTPEERLGYVCTGLSSKHWEVSSLTNVTDDVTINAIYTYRYEPAQVTVSFFTGDGGTVVVPMTGRFGTPFSPPVRPLREGYYFTGWYADEELTNLCEFSSTTKYPSSDITLYAGWELNSADATSYDFFDFILTTDKTGYILTTKEEKKASLPAKLVIPRSYDGLPVLYIGDDAFRRCLTIETVFIPKTVLGLGAFSFSGQGPSGNVAMNITSIVFEAKNPISIIPISCFSCCPKLTEIRLPLAIMHIYANAFSGCTALTTVNFSSLLLLDIVYSSAFENCSSLTSGVFYGLGTLYSRAFSGCTSLTSLTLNTEEKVTLDDCDALPSTITAVYVPEALLEVYKSDAKWKTFNLSTIKK